MEKRPLWIKIEELHFPELSEFMNFQLQCCAGICFWVFLRVCNVMCTKTVESHTCFIALWMDQPITHTPFCGPSNLLSKYQSHFIAPVKYNWHFKNYSSNSMRNLVSLVIFFLPVAYFTSKKLVFSYLASPAKLCECSKQGLFYHLSYSHRVSVVTVHSHDPLRVRALSVIQGSN